MNFTNPFILFGLLAVAAPIIIHLLNRRRHRIVKWAAMEFILKATRESRGKKKLKHLIILTARALIIAGLVFAFSEPFRNKLGSAGIPDTVILVLDRSPSMELVTNEGTKGGGKSKRVLAIENVQKTMKDMPETRLLLLDSATKKLTEISSPDVLTDISQTNISHKDADIPRLLAAAASYATSPDENLGNAEIWVASDLQSSNWDLNAKQWKSVNTMLQASDNVKLRFLALNETSQTNNSVKVVKTWREGNDLVIETKISRTSAGAKEAISITYAVNGGQSTDDIIIDQDTKTIRKRIPLQKSVKKGHGYVSINADSNKIDNVSYFVFGEKINLETVIVSEQGSSLKPLLRAAAVPTFKHLTARVLKPSETRNLELTGTPLVIWQAPLPSGKRADTLTDYIKNGGLVLFFPPEQESTQEFLGLKWGPIQKASRDSFYTVSTWNHNDGPFRDGISGDVLPLNAMDTITRRPIIGDAISLASFEDGEIFSTRKILENGRAVFISTLPDLRWSRMHETAMHLIVVHRMLEVATERFNANSSATVGSELLELRPRENRERLDNYTTTEANNSENEAGVWQLGQRTIAANRSSEEDKPELIEKEEIKLVLPDTPYTLLEDRGDNETSSIISYLWRFFLYGAILFLILEAILTLQKKVSKKPAKA